MKTLLILFFLPLTLPGLHGQSLEWYTMPAAGAVAAAPDRSLQLSWTIGQAVSGSLHNETFVLSQGFQYNSIALNPTAATELFERFQVRIFPNPTSEWLHLEREAETASTEWTVSIFAVQGKILKGSKLNWPAAQRQISLPVAGLPAGTYFVVLRNRTQPATASVPFVKF